MKKLILSILIIVLIFIVPAAAAFAANPAEILEVPDVKIIMDGKLTQFQDVPICIGQNTLLPLRELLVNLGVPNDDTHIVYNANEKSVTVYKDQTKLYLAVGNQTAYVNDQPVKLNIAPVGYNKYQRIYIAFRFVAEALGKIVVWDGSSNAILVCDAVQFDQIRQIMDRSDEAMKQAGKYRQVTDLKGTVKSGQITMNIKMNVEANIDKLQKQMYMKMNMDMLGMEIITDTYYNKNVSYFQDPLNQTWEKKTYLPAEYDMLFEDQSNMEMLLANDSLCAGLVRMPDVRSDEILLKGNVYLNQLLEKSMAGQGAASQMIGEDAVKFDLFTVEISLNSNTYLVNSISLNASSTQISGKSTAKTDIWVTVKNSDFNGDFQIIVPEDIVKNAVEENQIKK